MKKLLAILLLLVVYPAYSQDYTYSQVGEQPPLQNINVNGGTNLNLSDDGMAFDVKIGFDFEFYGDIFDTVNISNNGFLTFGGRSSMCCQGNQLPSFGMDNSISGLWTDLISTNGANPYVKSFDVDGERWFTVGWYGTFEYYNTSAPNTFEISLYEGTNNILFNYGDVNVFGHNFTIGLQGTEGQFEQIYTGTNSNQFDNTAYLFTYTPPEPVDPIAPDCTINPSDTSCIIQSITNTPTETYVAETNNTEDQPTFTEEQQTQTEPTVVADTGPTVIGGEALSLEELLAIADSATANEEQEETEKELQDDILAGILEQVLTADTTIDNDRKNNNITESETVETVTISTITNDIEQQTLDGTEDIALTVAFAENVGDNTESFMNESTETVESFSSMSQNIETSFATIDQPEVIENNTVIDDSQETFELLIADSQQDTIFEETVTEQTDFVDLPVFTQQQTFEQTEIMNIDMGVDNNDIDVEQYAMDMSTQSYESFEQVVETTVSTSVSEQNNLENELIESIIANSNNNSNQSTFEDSDQNEFENFVPIAGTNTVLNSSQIFGNNSMADKEAAGVFGKTEDKSDAEKRAEEIVAANAKEQEEINNNYMDADQSGLIGAIAGDTDVRTYRTAMIPDLSSWYKPEDIYKNVKYNDNVRGMYFLEKGNTDTYKQMVEEQYK